MYFPKLQNSYSICGAKNPSGKHSVNSRFRAVPTKNTVAAAHSPPHTVCAGDVHRGPGESLRGALEEGASGLDLGEEAVLCSWRSVPQTVGRGGPWLAKLLQGKGGPPVPAAEAALLVVHGYASTLGRGGGASVEVVALLSTVVLHRRVLQA